MTLVEELLVILSNYPGGYRLMQHIIRGDFPHSIHALKTPRTSVPTFRTTLARLKARGLVTSHGGIWKITGAGRRFLSSPFRYRAHRSDERGKGKKKDLVVAFDIPERFRAKRDWIRIELSYLGFVKLQQSVWLGPSPLPEDFVRSLQELDVLAFMRFFSAREVDIV